jgi:hypothetical protein
MFAPEKRGMPADPGRGMIPRRKWLMSLAVISRKFPSVPDMISEFSRLRSKGSVELLTGVSDESGEDKGNRVWKVSGSASIFDSIRSEFGNSGNSVNNEDIY